MFLSLSLRCGPERLCYERKTLFVKWWCHCAADEVLCFLTEVWLSFLSPTDRLIHCHVTSLWGRGGRKFVKSSTLWFYFLIAWVKQLHKTPGGFKRGLSLFLTVVGSYWGPEGGQVFVRSNKPSEYTPVQNIYRTSRCCMLSGVLQDQFSCPNLFQMLNNQWSLSTIFHLWECRDPSSTPSSPVQFFFSTNTSEDLTKLTVVAKCKKIQLTIQQQYDRLLRRTGLFWSNACLLGAAHAWINSC